MANTIQLKLLENRTVVAEIDGRNYAYEGGYHIIAGEQNATEFEIVSVPKQYKDATVFIECINAYKKEVEPPKIIDNRKFTLPGGMAVAGYGLINLTLLKGEEKVPFMPFKIKVANNRPDWQSQVIVSVPIEIGTITTLPAGSQANVKNIGTDEKPVLNFEIPQGKDGKDALPIKILGDTYYDTSLTYSWSTATLLPLPAFSETDEGTAYLVDDDEIKGQYDLYIHNYNSIEWVVINNWGGIPGQPGEEGVGIISITANGMDLNGGNIYKITLSNGQTANFTAPKGAKGDVGVGISTITNGTPFVSGDYTVTSITIVKTDGTSQKVNVSAKNGENFNETATYPNMTVGKATNAESATKLANSRSIDGISFDGSSDINRYVVCSSSPSVAAKSIIITGLTIENNKPVVGVKVAIKFTYANTVNSPTLNVNSTGAIPIKADGDTTYVKWLAGAVMEFIYDGTNWFCVSGYQLQGKRVGYEYISNENTSPSTLYGGSWTQLPEGYALWTATSGAGNIISAGLPNITGTFRYGVSGRTFIHVEDLSGAFSGSNPQKSSVQTGTETSAVNTTTTFDANAGASTKGIYGNSATVQPPAYKVYAWKRTA